MSVNTWVNTGTAVPRPAGGTMPLCASSATSAVVLSMTVLPPVFGPLMSSVRSPPCISSENGITTTPRASSSGCRAVQQLHGARRRPPPRAPRPAPRRRSARGPRGRPPDAHLERIGEDVARRTQDRGELPEHPEHSPAPPPPAPPGTRSRARPPRTARRRACPRWPTRRARCRRALARVAAHRDDVAAAAHGDAGVLDGRLGIESAKDAFELPHEPLARRLDLAPGGGERGARGVEQARRRRRPRARDAGRWTCPGGRGERGGERRLVGFTRRSSPSTSRDALSTTRDVDEIRPSSTDPSMRSRASARDTSGTGSATSLSPRRKTAATSPTSASSPGSTRDRRWAGERARGRHRAHRPHTRRPPRAPPQTRDRSSPSAVLSSGQARRGARLGTGGHPVEERLHLRVAHPRCSSSRTIWLITLPSARPERRHDLAHHLAEILRAARDHLAHRRPDLLGVDVGWEVFLQHLDLRLLHAARSVRPPACVLLDRLRGGS